MPAHNYFLQSILAPCLISLQNKFKCVLAKNPYQTPSVALGTASKYLLPCVKRRLCSKNLVMPSQNLYSTQMPMAGLVRSYEFFRNEARIP